MSNVRGIGGLVIATVFGVANGIFCAYQRYAALLTDRRCSGLRPCFQGAKAISGYERAARRVYQSGDCCL